MTLAETAMHGDASGDVDFYSYRMTITSPSIGTGIVILDLEHDRMMMSDRSPGGATDVTYLVGKAMYLQTRGRWLKMDLAHPPKISGAAWRKSKVRQKPPAESALPDRMINGVLMRATSSQWPTKKLDPHAGPGTVTVICLYEKASGRARSCSAGKLLTITFDHYDDPSNHFTVPAAALHAPLMSLGR